MTRFFTHTRIVKFKNILQLHGAASIVVTSYYIFGMEWTILVCSITGFFLWKGQLNRNKVVECIEDARRSCLAYQDTIDLSIQRFDRYKHINDEKNKMLELSVKLKSHYRSIISELRTLKAFENKNIDVSKLTILHDKIYNLIISTVNKKRSTSKLKLDKSIHSEISDTINNIMDLLHNELLNVIYI